MKVIEAIGKGFNIASKSLSVLIVLFVFNAIWNMSSMPFLGIVQPAAQQRINPQLFGLSLIFILINIFIQGGLFGVVKDAAVSNSAASLNNFAKYGKKFYLRFLGLGAVVLSAIALAALIIILIFGSSIIARNMIVSIILVSLAIILTGIMLYYLFIFFLSPYLLVVDDVSIFKALGNSLRFIRTHFAKMIGLTTLLVLIGFGIGFIMGILTGILSLLIKGIAFQVLTGVITGAVNSYITIIISGALIVYYCGVSGCDQEKKAQGPSASA